MDAVLSVSLLLVWSSCGESPLGRLSTLQLVFLVNAALDPQFDTEKVTKITFLKCARTLKIELAPGRQLLPDS